MDVSEMEMNWNAVNANDHLRLVVCTITVGSATDVHHTNSKSEMFKMWMMNRRSDLDRDYKTDINSGIHQLFIHKNGIHSYLLYMFLE